MITPALLILGSASLIATALVRLTRIVDRVRKLADLGNVRHAELDRAERRANLALVAVAVLFAAVVVFVATGVAIAIDRTTGDRFSWLPISLALFGMGLIVIGSGSMLLECGYSAAQIRDEIDFLRHR
jgi:hydrogenase-4 membrane subunit HyfE